MLSISDLSELSSMGCTAYIYKVCFQVSTLCECFVHLVQRLGLVLVERQQVLLRENDICWLHTISQAKIKQFGRRCDMLCSRCSAQHAKLDPKALKCIFLGYFLVQEGYRCYYPSLNKYFISPDVICFEHSSFNSLPSFSLNTSRGEHQESEDDFLVYSVISLFYPLPTSSLHVSTSIRPPITKVYGQQQPPSISCPILKATSSLDPKTSDDL